MKNVIIFGGSGFLGSYIVKELAAAGHVITIFARDSEKANALKLCGNLGQIITIKEDILTILPDNGDINKGSRLDKYIKGQDIIINLIGVLTNNEKYGRNYTVEDINYKAAALIAKSAKNNNIEKLIHFSALLPNNIETEYIKSKIKGEQAVKEIFPQALIIKPGLVFGEEDKFFNLFARIAKMFRVLPIIAGGTALIQPIYVGDIAKFIRLLIAEEGTLIYSKPSDLGHTANSTTNLQVQGSAYTQGESENSFTTTSVPNNTTKTYNYNNYEYNLVGAKVYSLRELMIIIRDILKIRCFLIKIPYKLALLIAWFLEFKFLKPLNKLITSSTAPLLTREEVELLNHDNKISDNAEIGTASALSKFGIRPKTVEEILPKYLDRI